MKGMGDPRAKLDSGQIEGMSESWVGVKDGVEWRTEWDNNNVPERIPKCGEEGKAQSLREFLSLSPLIHL